ncbi:MAG: helix-turn-helix domain-containing protein [Clostridiales bacterium]|nr:helix-turn-helix domain-containing protein [Clostridiales bacterium]
MKITLDIVYIISKPSSAAAEELSMHRNNVTYHIRQISESCPWNLNNPNIRLKLLLSFSLLKYLDRIK